LVVALALLYFFWGLARFILNAGGGKEQEEAKAIMLWGIIALFVMISVWGIVRLLGETLLKGVNSDAIPIDRLVPDSFGPNNPLGP
jgi:TM2 domain-containing membrane protein YozV